MTEPQEKEWFFPFQDVDGDRTYSDLDFAKYYANLFTNGVFMGVGDGLLVTADTQNPAMKIIVKSGSAFVNGRQYTNKGDTALIVPVASSNQNRTDSVVLRLDLPNRKLALAYKSNDTTVTRNEHIYELQLATVNVDRYVTVVNNANITDKRADENVCGYASPFEKVNVSGLEQQYSNKLYNTFNTFEKAGNKKASDFTSFITRLQEQVNKKAIEQTSEQDNIKNQMKADFQAWFDLIKDSLSNKELTKLANRFDNFDVTSLINVEIPKAKGYIVTQVLYQEYALGLVPLGTEPVGSFGGTNLKNINFSAEYIGKTKFKLSVPNKFSMLSPTIAQKSDTTIHLYDGKKSIFIILTTTDIDQL